MADILWTTLTTYSGLLMVAYLIAMPIVAIKFSLLVRQQRLWCQMVPEDRSPQQQALLYLLQLAVAPLYVLRYPAYGLLIAFLIVLVLIVQGITALTIQFSKRKVAYG